MGQSVTALECGRPGHTASDSFGLLVLTRTPTSQIQWFSDCMRTGVSMGTMGAQDPPHAGSPSVVCSAEGRAASKDRLFVGVQT